MQIRTILDHTQGPPPLAPARRSHHYASLLCAEAGASLQRSQRGLVKSTRYSYDKFGDYFVCAHASNCELPSTNHQDHELGQTLLDKYAGHAKFMDTAFATCAFRAISDCRWLSRFMLHRADSDTMHTIQLQRECEIHGHGIHHVILSSDLGSSAAFSTHVSSF